MNRVIKERLEEIKENWNNVVWGIDKSDINWLIKQAEQVQELEETNKKNYWIAADFKFENLKLEQQNKRYREAIDYVMTAEATQYRSLENALEDIKFVINETLESD